MPFPQGKVREKSEKNKGGKLGKPSNFDSESEAKMETKIYIWALNFSSTNIKGKR